MRKLVLAELNLRSRSEISKAESLNVSKAV